MDLNRQVVHEFRSIVEGGCLAVEASTTSPYFGDALVTLAGRNFKLRVVRDRGDITVDMSRPDADGVRRDDTVALPHDLDDWFPAEWLVAVVGGSPPEPAGTLDIASAAAFVAKNHDGIVAAYTPEAAAGTRARLTDISRILLVEMKQAENRMGRRSGA